MSGRLAHTQTLIVGLTLALVTSFLTGCSHQPPIGQVSSVDGGNQIVVPALWANGETNEGGIEPATVWVDTTRASDQLSYDVNLSDVQSKGGGAMWQAATGLAAAIGTLFSGYDPDNVAYRFDITGPIDGPSAGGILTVGVLAAINNHSLLSGTTMTGTIIPDGSIGPVGLIGQKLVSAAEEGFHKVIIPAANTLVSDPKTGEPVDPIEYGKTLGLEVVFTHNVSEAYELLTEHSLSESNGTSQFQFSSFPELDNSRRNAAEGLISELRELISANPETPNLVVEQLALAEQKYLQDEPSKAFGLAVDCLDQFASWYGSNSLKRELDQNGQEVASVKLRTEVDAKLVEINSQLDESATGAMSQTAAEQLAYPGALGWLTYSIAVLEAVSKDLQSGAPLLSEETLIDYASLVEQVSLESSMLFPHILKVLQATPQNGETGEMSVPDFLSGYTTFLVTAGNANLEYLHSVTGLESDNAAKLSVLDLVPVAVALSEEAQLISPQTEELNVELKESSTAMTYFVVTTSLVSSIDLLGTTNMWLSPEQASLGSDSAIDNSISQSRSLVENTTNSLLGQDLNAGFPLWSSEWGGDTYEELIEQNRSATGASIALNELWYDVITVLSMRAYANTESK